MNRKPVYYLLGAAVVVVGIWLAFALGKADEDQPVAFFRDHATIVKANGMTEMFDVELAITQKQHERGLMYRQTMPANAGMLFVFRPPEKVGFWMKNTYLPLDMLFLRADGTIVKIVPNTVPQDLRSIPSDVPVAGVLEINAGESVRRGIKVGDKIKYRAGGGREEGQDEPLSEPNSRTPNS